MSASKPPINILLADDDEDDCLFFQDALKELPVSTLLQTVSNGDQLMERLHDKQQFLPDLLFLDLNMPRKNGLDCLEEIKQHTDLNRLFIAIYSTSLQQHIVDKVHEIGAQYYICKPTSFSKLKNLIFQTIAFKETDSNLQPSRGKFVLSQEIFTNEKK
ncbi:MAG: response regulator [Ferruginibacter sp.]|nr:response regulator [Ferruginibacter sp.]